MTGKEEVDPFVKDFFRWRWTWTQVL
jgi:hypothetical protein